MEDAAGSHASERASRRASSDVKTRLPRAGQTTAAPATSEGQSLGSQSRQSGGAQLAEAETEVEAEREADPEDAEISKDHSEEPEPTPVVKDSLTAISGPAKRRLPMLCQARHACKLTLPAKAAYWRAFQSGELLFFRPINALVTLFGIGLCRMQILERLCLLCSCWRIYRKLLDAITGFD